jgi:hypothetical protein
MKPIIVEANIKPSQIEIPVETDNISTSELAEGHDWLKAVFEKQYAACKETKNLLPEEQWAHYRNMDMDGTIEMRELKERLRELRRVIINKNRPRVFRRNGVKSKKRNQSTQDEAECVQD